jgi:alkylhydroperoxidase family enzyme
VRIDLPTVARAQVAAPVRFEESIELDRALRELVKMRASQTNGCAYCLDIHWKDARGR